MTASMKQEQAVRRHLAQTTHALHDALHGHPVFRPLTSPLLTKVEYYCALTAFYAFYTGVERARAKDDDWHDFSVARECCALDEDLADRFRGIPVPEMEFDTRDDMLGGLYVALGAAFGRASFRRNVIAAVPRGAHAFLSLQNPSHQWRRLLLILEHRGADPGARHRIERGATQAFRYVTDIAEMSRPTGKPATF
jgi:heme oxygenase